MSKIIAVDFDGTLCENKWPEIGKPNWEVINYLKQQKEAGATIILWTCRTDIRAREAYLWCIDRGLVIDEINRNAREMIAKFGEDTRKIYADEYIDDRAVTKFKLPYRADNADRCIACGEVIPEGWQVCNQCWMGTM